MKILIGFILIAIAFLIALLTDSPIALVFYGGAIAIFIVDIIESVNKLDNDGKV